MTNWLSHVVQTDDGELAIVLPPDMLAQMGWSQDTELFWDIDKDGSVFIKEQKNEDHHSR